MSIPDPAHRAATFQKADPRPPFDLDVFGAPDVFLQVVDPGDAVVARSGNLSERVLPLPAPRPPRPGCRGSRCRRPLFRTAAPLDAGRHVVVARSPVTTYALRTLRQLLTGVVSGAVLVTALAR